MKRRKPLLILFLLVFQTSSFFSYSATPPSGLAVPNINATLLLPASVNSNPDTAQLTPSALEMKAEALLHKVKTSNRYIGLLAANQAYELPVGIQKNIAGVEYTIVLDDLTLDPTGANLKAYMTVGFPGSDKKLGFFADNVRLGPNGIETAQLKLIKDKDISLGAFTLRFRCDITSIDWDCNGYKSTTIGGDVIFPSNLIKPTSGSVADSVAMGSFFANFTDFNDVVLGFSMEPFEVNGLPDFEFHPGNVFVDISDLRNPPGTIFPAGFFPANQPQQLNTLWRGLVIPEFTVKLPAGLGKNNSESVEIGAQNMIIDANGITGRLFAANVLSLEQGNLGGWEFSIDTLGFTFFKNSFSGFNLTGEIKVPISDEQKGFRYAGLLDSQSNLTFSVAYTEEFNANLWGAQLLLEPNSTIEIVKQGNTYKPQAILHGQMSIALGNDVSLGTFEFQELVLGTEAPNLSKGNCSIPNGLLAGFPVSVTHLSFVQDGNLVGLAMQANVSFMASAESGFGGDGSFTIWAERTSSSGKTKYQYKETQVSGISINVDQGGFEFNGSVAFYQEHAIYGKGFRGMINAKFTPGISVNASAQFGSVNGYRYWYVDALASQSAGIPIFTGVAIYGFGGGVSYKMKQTEPSSYSIPTGNHTSTDNSTSPGIVFSGATYVPNETYGLGLKASVVLGTHPNPKAVNGQVSFRIQFYSSGGIESVRFQGEACMASDLRSNPSSAPLRLSMDIAYNFTNKDLYGVNEAYVNLGVVKGTHANNKAGSVIFRFNPSEWYVHMGTPDSRIGLKVFNSINFASYLMVGTNIPPFPAPPSNVSNKVTGTNVQSFEEGLISTGSGFAFGSSFNMDTGEEKFLIFYGSFSLYTGFDIMLRDYGTTAFCEGFPPPIGVNGWYAMGQAYAFMSGRIGVEFKLFGNHRKMDILAISASALLQAKLPNPIYFKGHAGGSYNILGGLVKGQCNFEFSVGDNCVVKGADPLGNISVIADISPSSGNTNVSVFVTPQVAFNMPLNEPFQLVNENNETQTFRIVLSHLQVLINNSQVQGNTVWNSTNDVVSFETVDIYPSFTDVNVKVRVVFQRMNNGKWNDYMVGGQTQREEQSITFTTGERPDHIPSECIVYTYPVANMMNFHWREHGTGYIKLTHDFSYLLSSERDWQGVVIFEGENPNIRSNYTYSSSDTKITFPIPQNLSSQMVYSIRVSKVPTTQAVAIDANVERTLAIQTEAVELTQTNIEGEREVELERVLFQLKARTSLYATFSEKIDLLELGNSAIDFVLTGIYNIITLGSIPEKFDEIELESTLGNPLINLDFLLSNNYWYQTYINPLVYQGYPRTQNLTITWRDANSLGIPPTKAAYLYQALDYSNLNQPTVGSTLYQPGTTVGLKFNGVYVMYQDFMDMRIKAAAQYNPNGSNASIYNTLINGFFHPIILEQEYVIAIKYTIPGENIITTEKQIICEI